MMNMYSRVKENNRSSVPAGAGQRKSSGMIKGFQDNRPLAIAQRKMCDVIQQKKVTTNYGDFETTRFGALNYGVDIRLEFHPKSNKVDAKKIGLVQTCCAKNYDKAFYTFDPRGEKRIVKSGVGEGYQVDRTGDYSVPVYGVYDNQIKDLGKISRKDTTYGLGKCFKGYFGGQHLENAWLEDTPQGDYEIKFETTALALEGVDKNRYYGSVNWGYGHDENNSLIVNDIEVQSNENVTSEFKAAAQLWNRAKSNQTLKANKNILVGRAIIPKGISGRRNTSTDSSLIDILFKVSNGTECKFQMNKVSLSKTIFGKYVVNDDQSETPVSLIEISENTLMEYREGHESSEEMRVEVADFKPLLLVVKKVDVNVQDDGVDNVPLPIPSAITP